MMMGMFWMILLWGLGIALLVALILWLLRLGRRT